MIFLDDVKTLLLDVNIGSCPEIAIIYHKVRQFIQSQFLDNPNKLTSWRFPWIVMLAHFDRAPSKLTIGLKQSIKQKINKQNPLNLIKFKSLFIENCETIYQNF